VKNLCVEKSKAMGKEDWQLFCKNVKDNEHAYKEREIIFDDKFDSVIISSGGMDRWRTSRDHGIAEHLIRSYR
jgi:hypothetical protein